MYTESMTTTPDLEMDSASSGETAPDARFNAENIIEAHVATSGARKREYVGIIPKADKPNQPEIQGVHRLQLPSMHH